MRQRFVAPDRRTRVLAAAAYPNEVELAKDRAWDGLASPTSARKLDRLPSTPAKGVGSLSDSRSAAHVIEQLCRSASSLLGLWSH